MAVLPLLAATRGGSDAARASPPHAIANAAAVTTAKQQLHPLPLLPLAG
jgi:hypothetical protein